MSKKLIIYTISIITITALLASFISTRAFNGGDTGEWHEQCQYPTRPLKNGNCDNSDPVDPTNVNKGLIKQANKPKKQTKKVVKSVRVCK